MRGSVYDERECTTIHTTPHQHLHSPPPTPLPPPTSHLIIHKPLYTTHYTHLIIKYSIVFSIIHNLSCRAPCGGTILVHAATLGTSFVWGVYRGVYGGGGGSGVIWGGVHRGVYIGGCIVHVCSTPVHNKKPSPTSTTHPHIHPPTHPPARQLSALGRCLPISMSRCSN